MEAYPKTTDKPRKRVVNKAAWKRTREKLERYSSPGAPKKPSCKNHCGKTFSCTLLTHREIRQFHDMFYLSRDKLKQDAFILKYTDHCIPKRSRKTTCLRENRAVSVKYYIPTLSHKKVPVCQKTFLGILLVTKHRAQGVIQRFMKSGKMPVETRGGNRKEKLFEKKARSVQDFIEKFPVIENHYCRSKTSAVNHCLKNIDIPENVERLRLMCDGCGGQNKNTTMIGMLCSWLQKAPAHLQQIELIFPMVGHSFLPSDRVFARIEKDIKKHEVLVLPQDYVNIFAEHGTPINLEDKVFDWKSACQNVIKQPGNWHFQFNPTKYFFIIKQRNEIVVRGEQHYRSHFGKALTVFRKKCSATHIKPKPIVSGEVNVNPLKLSGISALLKKHFGEDFMQMPDLQFYQHLLETQVDDIAVDAEQEACTNKDTDGIYFYLSALKNVLEILLYFQSFPLQFIFE
ncbi:unnamed protein product [Callosobruchus maculatus]|uniref:DUF7869 domain-containing protein n=1 Tax=Callosobruchus maculatus TaxID=64391 RepID=A0A653BKL9_CALMS|nr:unnamed protein product [Callosobruchus maculatus]